MRIRMLLTITSLSLLFVSACATPSPTATPPPAPTPTPSGPRTLTLMTHDSFAISESVIQTFEQANNVTVQHLPSGDTGAALNQAILSKANPLADLFFGVDNTFLSRAIEADIFEPYDSPMLAEIPDQLELDSKHRLLPVDFGDVCLNYDKVYFQEKGLAAPQTLEDLVKPEYQGLTVVENPATSSPGLAFLIATVGHFGQDGDYTYRHFWRDMRANDVLVTEGWEDAYWGQTTWYGGGRPIVVSYATSPAAEVFFSEGAITEPPTGNVLGDGACFRQIEFVGILKGTENRDLAEKFIDFMLGVQFQEDIPLNMWVFPANNSAALPQVFTDFAQMPENPAFVSPEDIAAYREGWVEAWTEDVLR
ncbi:MAG: thiamine ABC transporter substrate-binding protein [Anaerolineae bacterium]|nr:MAG: thiamine ABC transporter substrate-binding protein [Anaerolineae bacterium]